MTDDAHIQACPKYSDPAGHCQCAAIEERMIARAGILPPAELIRRAKAKGLVKGVEAYQGSA